MIPSPKQLALIAMLCLTTFAAHAQLPILAEHEWEPVRDEVYLQEIEGRLPTKHPILAVAVFNGVLYAGSANGVEVLDGDKLVPAKGPEGTVSRLKVLNGALYAFTPTKLWRYDSKTWKSLADGNFTDGCVHLGSVVIASPQTLYRVDGDQLVAINEKTSPAPILGVSSYAETLYVRYENSVRFYHEGQFDEDLMKDWGHLPIGSKTRDMMPLGSRLMVPTTEGVATLSGMTWKTITGDNGLCYEDTTCIARGFEKQDFWVGTTRGAIRAVNGEYQYFGGQRWLPNDKVNAIASGDNVVYIATDGGLGIITYEPYTLEKKAAYYERWLDEWGMRRLGFVSTLTWDEKNQEWIRFISDNDGGWAGHLLNGLSFKYAVTKDPEVQQQAIEVFRALKWCEHISGIPGFPARAIATVGEPSHLAETGSAGLPSEWNATADGKWLWKGDTSSDEVGSHIQSTMIFYELAAEGKSKDAAREHMDRINAHIVDNGWVLRDLDGKPTRWARWDPEFLDTPYGFEQRGLNSLEALGQIEAAIGITGKDKFKVAKQQLVDWKYPDRVLRQKLVFPVVTHFDDRLAFLAYHPLLTYEKDPTLRSIYMRSLERSWEVKRVENMVWFNYIYGALTGNEMDNERSIKNLREWPLDCVSYTYTNSIRTDLKVPEGYTGYIADWKCMSARDIGPVRWDSDFQRLDGGGGGKTVNDPSAFIDAYWMARYYGMILPPDTKDPKLLTVEKRNLQLGAKPYAGPPRPDVGF